MGRTAMQQAIDILTMRAHKYELNAVAEQQAGATLSSRKYKNKSVELYDVILYLSKLRDTVEREQIMKARSSWHQASIDADMLSMPMTDEEYYEETYKN